MSLFLAPMEGVLDYQLRALLTEIGGFDACVTEFVRVSGNLLPRRIFHKYCPELKNGGRTPSGQPVYLQLLGSDPTLMAENAARAAELGAPGIDLNFGCPAKTVNRHGGGAALLREPERVFAIVEAVRAAVPSETPVSAKMRLGYDDTSHTLELAQGIESAGAAWLTVHARTRAEGYRAPAHWEWLARIREVLEIPLIANGEIWSVEDARRCREVSGCEQLMIGRGALSDPWLGAAIAADREIDADWQALLTLLHRFSEMMESGYSERTASMRLKQWLGYLRRHYPEAEARYDGAKRRSDPAGVLESLRSA